MRRYLTTIVLLIVLLAIGGWAVTNLLGGDAAGERGAYVPVLSSDPQTASEQAILFVGGLVLVLGLLLGLAIFLAVTFNRLTLMLRRLPPEPAATRAAPAAKTPASQAPAIPLSSTRSVTIFWVVVALLVIGFQALRYLGTHSSRPLGFLPGIGELLAWELSLPGGVNIPALFALLGVLVLTVGAVAVIGFGLARGLAVFDNTLRNPDRLPRNTLPDRLIPAVETRVSGLRQPRVRRPPEARGLDPIFTALNIVLFLVIGAIVLFFVIPSYGAVADVDRGVKATQLAASITATPQQAGEGGGGGLTQVEAIQAELDELPPGNASGGEQVYNAYGCSGCHLLTGNATGPTFAGLGQTAATRKPDYTADQYLYESITAPNAFVVQGFTGGLMPPDFKARMQPQELADMIAWLKTH